MPCVYSDCLVQLTHLQRLLQVLTILFKILQDFRLCVNAWADLSWDCAVREDSEQLMYLHTILHEHRVLKSVLSDKIWTATQQKQHWHVHPVKTQISLCIHPVRSESLLSACSYFRPIATLHTHSKDCLDAQADRSPFWVHMPVFFFFHVAVHILRLRPKKILCFRLPDLNRIFYRPPSPYYGLSLAKEEL